MKEVTLEASLRQSTGKGAARQSRMAGNIPAVVYGPEIKSFPIEISEKVMRQAVKDSSFNRESLSVEFKFLIPIIELPQDLEKMHINYLYLMHILVRHLL